MLMHDCAEQCALLCTRLTHPPKSLCIYGHNRVTNCEQTFAHLPAAAFAPLVSVRACVPAGVRVCLRESLETVRACVPACAHPCLYVRTYDNGTLRGRLEPVHSTKEDVYDSGTHRGRETTITNVKMRSEKRCKRTYVSYVCTSVWLIASSRDDDNVRTAAACFLWLVAS